MPLSRRDGSKTQGKSGSVVMKFVFEVVEEEKRKEELMFLSTNLPGAKAKLAEYLAAHGLSQAKWRLVSAELVTP